MEVGFRIVLAMRLSVPIGLQLAFLALAGCGSGSEEAATDAAGGGETIEIAASEFAFDPSSVQVEETGTITFRVANDGSIPHALEVDGPGIEEETDTIEPGESAELTVDLTKEGSYELYCPIGDHRDQGMEGELIVGSAGGAGTGTMEDEDDGMTTDEDDKGGYGY